MNDLLDAVGTALGVGVGTAIPITGGDMAAAFRCELSDGRTVFAKTHPSPPSGFFSREASDLRWLADAQAVPVPQVLAVDDGRPAFLALEWIEHDARAGSARGGEDLGRGLAALHRSGAPTFGRQDRRTTGSLALPNDPADDWATFCAQCRLLPLARIARDRQALTPEIARRIERLTERLTDVGGPVEEPSRLHGDLWAGNRMIGPDGVSWLIDPAAHGGHREFDLAMMRLFGGFETQVFASYAEVFPLADGWQQRVPLHQLAPLVVHAVKFGGGYASAVSEALDAIGC